MSKAKSKTQVGENEGTFLVTVQKGISARTGKPWARLSHTFINRWGKADTGIRVKVKPAALHAALEEQPDGARFEVTGTLESYSFRGKDGEWVDGISIVAAADPVAWAPPVTAPVLAAGESLSGWRPDDSVSIDDALEADRAAKQAQPKG